jgi:pyruvate-ferredoxin/flavodoxin oxidoreductase
MPSGRRPAGPSENPFPLDSPRSRIPLAAHTRNQLHFITLARTDPAEAERLAALARHAVHLRWDTYEEMATRPAHRFAANPRASAQALLPGPPEG